VRTTLARLRSETGGATAVEFALVVWPFLMICLGIIQFLFLSYTQSTLSDALYGMASQPAIGTQAAYKSTICGKNAFTVNCTSNLKLERWTLANLPTSSTAVGSAAWQGVSGDIVVLRAIVPALSVIGFLPTMNASEAVIFRLP
jgi:Flp pilus assembly pilin Flp